MKRLLPLVAVLAFATCDSGPKEGELLISLTSPNSSDGAVSFTVTATDPETILGITAGCSGCQVFTRRISDTQMRGIVTGSVVPGTMARVMVSNIKELALYGATVQAVASSTFQVRNVGGYTLTVESP